MEAGRSDSLAGGRRQLLHNFFRSVSDVVLQVVEGTLEIEDPPTPAPVSLDQAPSCPPPVAAPMPPAAWIAQAWPGTAGSALHGYARARAKGEDSVPLSVSELTETLPERLEEAAAGAHLMLLPLTDALTLHAHYGCLRLLGLLGPEGAGVVSSPAAPNGAAGDEPVAVGMSAGILEAVGRCLAMNGERSLWSDEYLLYPDETVLAGLAEGRIRLAALTGSTLLQALTLPGIHLLTDPCVEWKSRPMPAIPWLPTVGLFATRIAWRSYATFMTALTEELAEHLSAIPGALRYHPIAAVRPWLEPFLEFMATQVPDACGGAAPAADFYGYG